MLCLFFSELDLWLSSLALPEETQDIDKLSYNFLRNKWYKLVEAGRTR